MFEEYLEETKYVDFNNPEVKRFADKLKSESDDELSLIRSAYSFVRDVIRHSWDVQDRRVTISASDVLREGVGVCQAKSNLLAALLRANGIPAGFSYQRLRLGDAPDAGYCLHALNTVYVSSLGRWIRLDARGNKEGIDAEFSIDEERLAFHIASAGEIDYRDNRPRPDAVFMKVLEESDDALEMCESRLPDAISDAAVDGGY